MLAKETLWNLTMPVLDRDLAAIIAGTVGGSPSKPDSFPCCPPMIPGGAPHVDGQRKRRAPRRRR